VSIETVKFAAGNQYSTRKKTHREKSEVGGGEREGEAVKNVKKVNANTQTGGKTNALNWVEKTRGGEQRWCG